MAEATLTAEKTNETDPKDTRIAELERQLGQSKSPAEVAAIIAEARAEVAKAQKKGRAEGRGQMVTGAFIVLGIGVIAYILGYSEAGEPVREFFADLDLGDLAFLDSNTAEAAAGAAADGTGEAVDTAVEDTQEATDLNPEQKKMAANLGLSEAEFQKYVDEEKIIVRDGVTYITNGEGKDLAKIVSLDSIKEQGSAKWFQSTAAGKDITYVVSTIGTDLPFSDTVKNLKGIGIDLDGKTIYYENHISDDNNDPTNCVTAEQWKNNQLIEIKYGPACAGPAIPTDELPTAPTDNPPEEDKKPADLCKKCTGAGASQATGTGEAVSPAAIMAYDEDILSKEFKELLIEKKSAVLADLESDSTGAQIPFIVTEGPVTTEDLTHAAREGHYQTRTGADGKPTHWFNVQKIGADGLERPYCIVLNDTQLDLLKKGGITAMKLESGGFLTLETPNGLISISDGHRPGTTVTLPKSIDGVATSTARPTSWWETQIKRDAHFTDFKVR